MIGSLLCEKSALRGQLDGEYQPPLARVLRRDYGRKVLEEELSLLTGALLCSLPYLIRLDGKDRRQPRASSLCMEQNVEANYVRRAHEG